MGRDGELFEGLETAQVLDVLRHLGVAVATIGKFTYMSQGDTHLVMELEDRTKRKTLQALSRTFQGVHMHFFFHPEMLPKD